MNELSSEPKPKFDTGNNKKYKIKTIRDNIIYTKEAKKYLLGLYYLVFYKGYLEKKNI